MYKKSKLLAALTLALVIGLTGITTALATEDSPLPPAAEASQAAITKLLQTPFGTEIPEMDFVFLVEPIGLNGVPNVEAASNGLNRNVVNNQDRATISFNGEQNYIGTENGISTYFLESGGLFNAAGFPQEGFYEYEITEIDSYNPKDGRVEAVRFSEASYKVIVYVIRGESGLEIAFIGVLQTKDDAGKEPEEVAKLDPTPGDDGDKLYSAMAFTNRYVRINLPDDIDDFSDLDPTKPNHSSLFINKEVAGDFASTEQYFNFALTIKVPNLISDFAQGPFTAVVVNVDNNGALTETGGTHAVNPNENVNFDLKANQRLVFVDTPVGTSFVVEEKSAPGYTISATVYRNGAQVGGHIVKDGNDGLMLNEGTIDPEHLFVGQTGSGVRFINDMTETLPMGINTNNLPFIGLIALALAGLVLFVVIKSRKTEDNT